jgi:hypothetical protein
MILYNHYFWLMEKILKIFVIFLSNLLCKLSVYIGSMDNRIILII